MALEQTIDGYVRLEDFTYNAHKYIYGYPRRLKKATLAKTIKRLRERGLIDFINIDDLLLKLTDEGKDQALWEKVKSLNDEPGGNWTLVIFDIPEKRRQARDLLREKLKSCGFVHFQKSVWASQKNCADFFRKYIQDLGIKDWVMVIRSTDVGWTKTPRS